MRTDFKLKVKLLSDVLSFLYNSFELCFFLLSGDSLPTPVPLPEENLRALAEFEAAYATGKARFVSRMISEFNKLSIRFFFSKLFQTQATLAAVQLLKAVRDQVHQQLDPEQLQEAAEDQEQRHLVELLDQTNQLAVATSQLKGDTNYG